METVDDVRDTVPDGLSFLPPIATLFRNPPPSSASPSLWSSIDRV